jgi:DNA repair protein RadA/Sms
MGKPVSEFACEACGHRIARWAGRCPSCGAWGQIHQIAGPSSAPPSVSALVIDGEGATQPRLRGALADLDRVLGGGLVPGSVVLLAGPPGIGKSTLLLQWLSSLSAAGVSTVLLSGEESRAQVAARARRLGVASEGIAFGPGRALGEVLAAARQAKPQVLAIDSIQMVRDTEATTQPGGVAQVRACTDALVALAKQDDVSVVLTGHVTKDGDLAGPKALEHAVDVVLSFEGDPRSGLRIVVGGKNRYGPEGETAWFEMASTGLRPIDPSALLRSQQRHPGAAVALPLAGRRALALEVQALVGGADGPARRQVTGLDLRRFQQVAAVLERTIGLPLGRAELYGAVAGGVRIDDPAVDMAIAAALASAAFGVAPPEGSAFLGEITLTGEVRPAPGRPQRLAAARAAGCTTVFAAADDAAVAVDEGLGVVPVGHVADALRWALSPAGTVSKRRAS